MGRVTVCHAKCGVIVQYWSIYHLNLWASSERSRCYFLKRQIYHDLEISEVPAKETFFFIICTKGKLVCNEGELVFFY